MDGVTAPRPTLACQDVAAAEAHLRSAEALGARGPVASTLVLAGARVRLQRAAPDDVEAALAAARSLVEAEGPPAADSDTARATDPVASSGTDSVAGSAAVAKGTAGPGDGVRIAALVLQALAEDAQGATVAAQVTLARAVRRAEPEGFVRNFVEAGQTCAAVLARLGPSHASRLLEAFPQGIRAHVAVRDAVRALEDR